MKILSIDASINNLGWSTFTYERCRIESKKKAWKWGTWFPEGTSLEMRIMDMCQTIQREVGDFDYLITEKPAFYSSERGVIAARQNYTIDLAAINYFIAGWFGKDHRHHFPVTAITWKGNVDKVVTQKHFFRHFFGKREKGRAGITEHAIDAAMLLRYWLENYAMVSPQLGQHISPELIRELI